MILYKIHVRGYTRQAKLALRKRGTFAGLTEMIPYWKELGYQCGRTDAGI